MDNESFGYAVYEAMAMGLAIVSVPSSALNQWQGNNAIAFSDDATSASLANTIINVIQNQADAKERVAAGRLVVQDFSWKNLSGIWKPLYVQGT
jgi:glycosyltransferase involved in cell wall biosynthesis